MKKLYRKNSKITEGKNPHIAVTAGKLIIPAPIQHPEIIRMLPIRLPTFSEDAILIDIFFACVNRAFYFDAVQVRYIELENKKIELCLLKIMGMTWKQKSPAKWEGVNAVNRYCLGGATP